MSTCAVNVSLVDLGLEPVAGVVSFTPIPETVGRVGNALVAPAVIGLPLSAAGTGVIDLVPGLYSVTVAGAGGWERHPAFTVTVPVATIAYLAQLIQLPPPPTLNAAEQAVLDAQAARDVANLAAANADADRIAAQTANTAAQVAKGAAEASEDAAAASAAAASSSAAAASTSASGAASDRTETAADRTQTGLDRTAAATSATASAASQAAAAASASAGATSAAASQASRLASESARDTSVSAKTASEAARDAAQISRTAAETAETAAETAQAASQSAKTASETARDAAAASATSATGSATTSTANAASALSSKNAAAASETAAASSATAAASSASAASTSASGALTDANRAVTARTGAEAAEVSAAGSAATATTQATAANLSAGQAAGSAASASAIYGSTAAQQTAVATAQAQASLAQGYAASASSVVQQDLSGVTAQALHRSPNAVTSMFIYDTSKDSDGGAWTEKCQHTSWWNEPIMGKWLGPQPSEMYARYEGATLGAELVANGDFAGSATGWTLDAAATYSNGAVEISALPPVTSALAQTGFSPVIGKTYRITFAISNYSAGGLRVLFAGISTPFALANGVLSVVGVATSTSSALTFINGGGAFTGTIDNISVREVTAINTTSGDYYQSTADGRFYRLWKNLFAQTSALNVSPWSSTVNATVADQSGGVFSVMETSATGAHAHGQAVTLIAGLTYTLTVEAQLGSGTRNARFSSGNSGIIDLTAVFDLSGGAVVSGSGASITSLGSGWYRISVTRTAVSGGSVIIYPFQFASGTTASYAGDGTSSILYRNPHFEIASAFMSYEAKAAEGSVSEVFRGNKRDFPRLAGVVVEGGAAGQNNIAVYDLTESGRPMWMAFRADSSQKLLITPSGYILQAASMLNSEMLVGGGVELYRVDFAADRAIVYSTLAVYRAVYNGGIAQRMELRGYTPDGNIPAIANRDVKAIAMTVLPDAPVDPVTGLRVPTIAVATAGGVSVIKHNGSVVSGGSAAMDVTLSKDILLSDDSGTNRVTFALNPGQLGSGFTMTSLNSTLPSLINPGPTNNSQKFEQLGRALFARAPAGRSTVNFARFAEGGPARSLVASVASTHNTGWMTGDIRRCFLSETGIGNLTAGVSLFSDLFTPDRVLTSSTSWRPLIATASVTGGVLEIRHDHVSSPTGRVVSAADLVEPGKTYRCRWTVEGLVGNATGSQIGLGSDTSGNGAAQSAFFNGAGSFETVIQVLPTALGRRIVLYALGGTATGAVAGARFSAFTVEEIVSERSFRSAWALVAGALTRAQLASGTSLVGYSGFSAANYLREPYSADLDFGTGEWTASAWVNIPTVLPVDSFPVVGSELNGLNWSAPVAGVTYDAGAFTFDGATTTNNASYSTLTPTTPVIVGRKYRISYRITGKTETAPIRMTLGGIFGIDRNANGEYVENVTASNTNAPAFTGAQVTAVRTGTVDNISIVEIGAASIFDRAHSAGPRIRLGVDAASRLTAEAFDGTTTRTVTTTSAYNTAQWLKAEACYTTDGSLGIRVNGREVAVTRGTPLLTLNNASAPLTIGNSFATDAPFPGSIALLKLGATVPTADQSVFMYEQEKQMFRENAASVLPDTGALVDMAYDDATDRWVAISGTNESYWTGLVRNSVTPVPAGSYTKIVAGSGLEMSARVTTNPGVDVTIPAYGLREELVKRAESAAKLSKEIVVYDYVGGFTATTAVGSTAITSAAGLTYPTSYIGARITGTGIPANTTILGVFGTTIYISAPATAAGTAVSMTFLDFILPIGMEAKAVMSAGLLRQEGATKDYTRLFDGFAETIRFAVAPGATAWVQVQATKGTVQ